MKKAISAILLAGIIIGTVFSTMSISAIEVSLPKSKDKSLYKPLDNQLDGTYEIEGTVFFVVSLGNLGGIYEPSEFIYCVIGSVEGIVRDIAWLPFMPLAKTMDLGSVRLDFPDDSKDRTVTGEEYRSLTAYFLSFEYEKIEDI